MLRRLHASRHSSAEVIRDWVVLLTCVVVVVVVIVTVIVVVVVVVAVVVIVVVFCPCFSLVNCLRLV